MESSAVPVRAGIKRGQEDVALLVLEFQVGGDEQQVAGEPRRVYGQQADLLEADPEISAVGHDFQHPGEQVVGVAERLEGRPVELSADGRDRLVGSGERLGRFGRPPLAQALTASTRSRKCSDGSPKNPGDTPRANRSRRACSESSSFL